VQSVSATQGRTYGLFATPAREGNSWDSGKSFCRQFFRQPPPDTGGTYNYHLLAGGCNLCCI